ncbi:MAG: UDP-3-O-(3-hydroxymyristoyl)glucosamine N-acyltransferase [Chlamydiia bacterium]|nr:UDP-3-O-(3-hydroxymyristoyl)glucosamine N-acyltransferase [Chlamydiia bacterium]
MKEISLETLKELTGAEVVGEKQRKFSNVADLESAQAGDISFLANPRYEGAMEKSNAGAVFLHPDYKSHPLVKSSAKVWLFHEEPSRAFQLAIEYFIPHADKKSGFKGVHATATIHPTAEVDPSVEVGPGAVIDEGVKIGKGTKIGALAYIGPFSEIGENCTLMPHVTLRERVVLQDRVIIQPGAVIGSCGYGYTPNKEGKHIKLNQVGNVVIESDVEIGANTTIDRSRFKETRIGCGTKIDNLVQIAHGVKVGQDNLIISQAGIAGSTTTGRHVVLAGQSGLSGHIHITDGVILAARAAASKSIDKPGKYNGAPCVPLAEYNRHTVYLRKIEKLLNQVKALEEKVHELENRPPQSP